MTAASTSNIFKYVQFTVIQRPKIEKKNLCLNLSGNSFWIVFNSLIHINSRKVYEKPEKMYFKDRVDNLGAYNKKSILDIPRSDS